MVTVEEGATVTLIINIDTGVVVENITLMITDGTTSMSKPETHNYCARPT